MRQPEDAPVEVQQLQQHGHHGVDEDDDLEGQAGVRGQVGGRQVVRVQHRGRGRRRTAVGMVIAEKTRPSLGIMH